MATEFRVLLKHLRLKSNYGLRQFAELIGQAPGNYAGVESGSRNPWRSVEMLHKIADALGLEESKSEWDEFFIAARNHKELPPDVGHLLKRPMIPVLLRTVDELKLSEDDLRKLVAYLQKAHKEVD